MPGISKSQILAIFSNTEQLLPMNQHLLSEIRLRVDTWHATQKVGDIFEKTVSINFFCERICIYNKID